MENINEIKIMFENGSITQNDMDTDTQRKLAELYIKEIEATRNRINNVRLEIDEYKKQIEELKNRRGL